MYCTPWRTKSDNRWSVRGAILSGDSDRLPWYPMGVRGQYTSVYCMPRIPFLATGTGVGVISDYGIFINGQICEARD